MQGRSLKRMADAQAPSGVTDGVEYFRAPSSSLKHQDHRKGLSFPIPLSLDGNNHSAWVPGRSAPLHANSPCFQMIVGYITCSTNLQNSCKASSLLLLAAWNWVFLQLQTLVCNQTSINITTQYTVYGVWSRKLRYRAEHRYAVYNSTAFAFVRLHPIF